MGRWARGGVERGDWPCRCRCRRGSGSGSGSARTAAGLRAGACSAANARNSVPPGHQCHVKPLFPDDTYLCELRLELGLVDTDLGVHRALRRVDGEQLAVVRDSACAVVHVGRLRIGD